MKVAIAVLLLVLAPPAFAQNTSTEVSGFVDMYYGYNFNTPSTPCATVGGVAVFNCLRAFDVAHNSFSLNLAEVALEKKPTAQSRGGFRIDLDFGSATSIVHGFEPGGTGTYQHIQQAYVSYLAAAGKGLQLDFGKFVTPIGNEVIETKDNWNYSRSLLFTLAEPAYHMGVRATYSPTDKISAAGFLVNGWNNVVDNNTGKTMGGSISIKTTPAVTITQNYFGGPEQTADNSDWRHLLDTIAVFTVNKQVALAANYDYGRDTLAGAARTWQGMAGYLRYQVNDWLALTPRAEWYDDADGFSTGTPQKVKEATVTAELKHKDGVTMRVEYRRDFSDVPFFTMSSNTLVKNQDTFTVGVIYAFSSKAP